MCWNEPSTLRLLRFARASIQVAARLTTTPTSATTSTSAALDVRRVDQAADALEQDQQGEHEQRDAVGLGREDLDALEAVGHHALRRPRGEPDRHQRERDRGRVGEHVAGVREQRERAGERARRRPRRSMKPRISASATASLRLSASAETPCACPSWLPCAWALTWRSRRHSRRSAARVATRPRERRPRGEFTRSREFPRA